MSQHIDNQQSSSALKRRSLWRDVQLLLAIFASLILAVALLSYSPLDDSWSVSHSGEGGSRSTHNAIGYLGAGIADVAFQILGSVAYVLPLMILLAIWRRFRHLHTAYPTPVRILGGALSLLSLCALCDLSIWSPAYLPAGMGGILGNATNQALLPLIGLLGDALLWVFMLAIGLMLLAEFSWLDAFEHLGEWLLRGIQLTHQTLFAKDTQAASNSEQTPLTIAAKSKPATQPDTQNSTQPSTDIAEAHESPSPTLAQKLTGMFGRAGKEQSTPPLEPSQEEREYPAPKGFVQRFAPLWAWWPFKRTSAASNTHADTTRVVEDPSWMTDTPFFADADEPPLLPVTQGTTQNTTQNTTQPQEPPRTQDATKPAEKSARESHQPARVIWPNTKPDTAKASKASAQISANTETKAEIKIEPLEKRSTGVSERVKEESQSSLFAKLSPLPPISLLDPAVSQESGFSAARLQELSELLVRKLADFNVKVEVTAIAPGPVITRFEIQPAPGVKASKITNLAKDLARSMAMISVRVVEVIPGKSVMGIEVPNEDRAIVRLSEVLSSKEYDQSKSPLTLAMGHDIGGNPVITDLAKAPHMLVAGTTGSGKSVGVNAMLLSMLLKATPDELKMILIDPKMLELSVYEGIPHLLTPVITDMKQAANGLRWSVEEMERRYQLMAAMGVRNIAGFNKKIRDAQKSGQPIPDPLWQIDQSFDTTPKMLEPLPYIVVVIDEFADMFMMVGKKVEELIARIAQKARAAGIHLVLATQRPSVDVITGLIKANIPTRVAFQVSSKIDSRTILDQGGADQLLGHGDMLFLPPGNALPERVHGAYVADDEVHRVVAEWKKRGEPQYEESIIQAIANDGEGPTAGEGGDEQDELYDLAVAFVLESGKCSISSVQRKLRIGYNRAARLVETMEASGVVSSPGHNGAREILVNTQSN